MVQSVAEVVRRAFIQDEVFDHEWGKIKIAVTTAANLRISTSRIVACDPFLFFDQKPFDQIVPSGQFPVILSIANYRYRSEDRIYQSAVF